MLSDPRAVHFWDPEQLIGQAFAPTLELDDAAWDVWLLFDGSATWPPAGLPAITWWEHQLQGLPEERRLDADRFAERARTLVRGRSVAP